MTGPIQTLAIGGGVAIVFMAVLWLVQLRTRDAGIVDFGWAFCIGGLAITWALIGPGSGLQRLIAGAVGGLWGFRLALHLLVDRVLPPGEDGRYAHLRNHWGSSADRHFLWFFAAQGLLALVFSLPFFALSQSASPVITPLQYVGLAVFVVAWALEGIADRQLAGFRRNPVNRGEVCRAGLWRYSRHPNYFFEWLVWCGISILAWPAPFGALALLAPAAMYVFVTKITGVPYTEAQSLRTRGDAYRRYQAETNAFFPGPRKRSACL